MGKMKSSHMDDDGYLIPDEPGDEKIADLPGEAQQEKREEPKQTERPPLVGIERDPPSDNLGGEPGTFWKNDARNSAGRK